MKKEKLILKMYEIGALAIIREKNANRIFDIAEACIESDLPFMEISYTFNNAGEIIKSLKDKYGSKLICGAGTVLDEITARHAILNNADFIIAPNFNKAVAYQCNLYQLPYIPACTSISEAIEALKYGAAFIKAFPIADFYGPKLVKVFKTPLPNIPILATGGINLENFELWLENGIDLCGFGSLLTKGSITEIKEKAKQIRKIIKSFREEYNND